MKNENITQDINKQVQSVCQTVELEYINSMLNIGCSDPGRDETPVNIVNSEQIRVPVDMSINKQADVECKVFSIAGLNLALPLSNVKTILQQHEILPVNGKGLHIGTINNNDEAIKVIDLTYLIMNGENEFDCASNYSGKRVDIILLKGSSVGIIYELELGNQIISPQHVRWRNATSDRLWLAGTVKQQGLSLLDLQGILDLINNPAAS